MSATANYTNTASPAYEDPKVRELMRLGLYRPPRPQVKVTDEQRAALKAERKAERNRKRDLRRRARR